MKTGIFALGSHQEGHGAALPPDTDAKIAEYMAEKTSEKTGAEFLETLESAHEIPKINTGDHQPLKVLVDELKDKVQKAKSEGFEGIVVVNAHGGNKKLKERLGEIKGETGVELDMDSTICNIEGPHAGTGEISVGAVIGIADESKMEEHQDVEKSPAVGFAGLEEAREEYDWAERHAQKIMEEGVEIKEPLGKELLQKAIGSAVEKVERLKSEN